MNASSVVKRLRDLAAEPNNRASIVKDKGCLPGLILFLDHPDVEVTHSALQALGYLSECPSNCEIMRRELGMMASLEKLRKRSDVGGDIRLLAEEIQYALSDSLRVNRTSTPENLHPKIKAPSFFLSSSTKTAKTITLHIQGLDNTHTRTLCEEALLKVKGVISFTFQTALKRCTVRVKSDLPTELLATAIATTKVLEAQQVIKNEGGKEIFIPLRAVNANLEDGSDLPAYLPEESPQEENEKAVLRTGTKSETSRSWIDAATNFLTKTFYW